MTHPKPDLRKLIDCHIQGTHTTLTAGCKSFQPMICIQAYDPVEEKEEFHLIGIVVDEFNDHNEKRKIMEGLGRKYYREVKKAPLAIALACEAWISHQTRVMPSEDDDRKEVLIIAVLGIDQSCAVEIMPIRRDKQDNIVEAAFVSEDSMKHQFPLLEHFYRGFFGDVLDKQQEGRRK